MLPDNSLSTSNQGNADSGASGVGNADSSDASMSKSSMSNTPSMGPSKVDLKPKNKVSPTLLLGLVGLVLAIVGGVAGLALVRTGQDIRQQAASDPYICTTSLDTICIEGIKYQCVAPGSPYVSTGQPCPTVLPGSNLETRYRIVPK